MGRRRTRHARGSLSGSERALFEAAKTVNEIVGAMPELVTRQGRALDEVCALLKEDRAIAILVLAAGTARRSGPTGLVDRGSRGRRLSHTRDGGSG